MPTVREISNMHNQDTASVYGLRKFALRKKTLSELIFVGKFNLISIQSPFATKCTRDLRSAQLLVDIVIILFLLDKPCIAYQPLIDHPFLLLSFLLLVEEWAPNLKQSK